MKRLPLFLFISGLGSIIAYENNISLLFSCALLFIAFLFIKLKIHKLVGMICLVFFILVSFRMNDMSTTTTSLNVSTKEFFYQGRICSFPIYKEDKAQFIMEVHGEKQEKVQAFIYENTHTLSYGDFIEFSGQVKLPEEKRNPGGFDYKQYLKGKNVYAILYINDATIKVLENEAQDFYKQIVSKFRKSFVEFIKVHFTTEEKDFLNGLLLGDKAIDPRTVDDFNKLGVSHILSVSGLHVGYVYIFVSTLCKLFKLNKKLQIFIISNLLYIYCFMVGFSESVLRASFMFILLLLAELTNKKYDTLNVLCSLAAAFVLYNPYVIYNVGFQLSYGAVASITIFYPYLNNKFKCSSKYLESAKSLALLTLSVQLGTIPFVLYHFYNLSVLSLIANLFIVPVSGFIIIGFLCVFFISLLLHLSFPLFMMPIKWSIHFILGLSAFLIKIPYAFITLGPMSLPVVSLYYFTTLFYLGYFYHYKEGRKKILTWMIAINLSIIIVSNLYPKPLIVTFLDVGQGDSTLIQCPDGTNILIDGGGRLDYSVGDQIIVKALHALNVYELSFVVCTHSDNDHKLGLMEILDDVKVGGLVINCLENEKYEDLISMAKGYNIPVYRNNQIKVKIQEDIHLDFLYPTSSTPYIDGNNSSIVTRLNYKNMTILLVGDLEEEGEQILLKNNDVLESEFLKIGHHGSRSSTSIEFLDKVNPHYGIISVGKNNRYNLPNTEVLELFVNQGTRIYRTDINGAIEIKTNGKNAWIKTYID